MKVITMNKKETKIIIFIFFMSGLVVHLNPAISDEKFIAILFLYSITGGMLLLKAYEIIFNKKIK